MAPLCRRERIQRSEWRWWRAASLHTPRTTSSAVRLRPTEFLCGRRRRWGRRSKRRTRRPYRPEEGFRATQFGPSPPRPRGIRLARVDQREGLAPRHGSAGIEPPPTHAEGMAWPSARRSTHHTTRGRCLAPLPLPCPHTASLLLESSKPSTTIGGTTITVPPPATTRSGRPMATTRLKSVSGDSL